MLRAILNKSWRQHPTRHQLYGHLPPITKTIQVRQTRHYWTSRDELIRDVLLWTPTYGRAKAGRPARTYIQQLCEDTGCRPEDLPEVMNDREKWRERVRDIRASGMRWWWWWIERERERKRERERERERFFLLLEKPVAERKKLSVKKMLYNWYLSFKTCWNFASRPTMIWLNFNNLVKYIMYLKKTLMKSSKYWWQHI